MSDVPLMPKATAVWLVENTSLTFDQIAEFCKLHPLEVKGIADGEVATGIKGYDPISTGQLTREEIAEAEQDPNHRLHLSVSKVRTPEFKKPRGARYTPLSRRQDRPNAVLWLLRNHPELKDAQIMRLVGTTKHTLQAIRDRTHWNSTNLQPMDPVTLGLCSQIDLDFEVNRAAKDRPKIEEDRVPDSGSGRDHHGEARAVEPARSVRRAEAEGAGRGEDRRRIGVRQAQGAARRGIGRIDRAAAPGNFLTRHLFRSRPRTGARRKLEGSLVRRPRLGVGPDQGTRFHPENVLLWRVFPVRREKRRKGSLLGATVARNIICFQVLIPTTYVDIR